MSESVMAIQLAAKRKVLVIAILLAGLTTVSYRDIRALHFLNYDDNRYITENPHLKEGVSKASLAWSLTAMYEANWHPVTWISHAIDCQIYGLEPAGHHTTNLIIHLLNVLLLFLSLRSLTGAIWRSGFVAGLFAVHPLNVESVAWAAERKNVLSTLFFILTLWAYGWYARRPGWKRYAVVLLLFVLGLMSKPMLVTLPFVLMLMDYWPLERYDTRVAREGPAEADSRGWTPHHSNPSCPPQKLSRLALEKAPLLLLAAAACVITVLAQTKGGAVASTGAYPMGLRIANSVVSYVKYLQQTIWPAGLSLLYPFPTSAITLSQIGTAAAVLLGVTAAAIVHARRFKYLIVGWLWYVGTLVPVIGLVQVGSQARADRYAYIPLIGVFVMMVWCAAESIKLLRHARPILAATGICVLVLLSLGTGRQVSYWRDDITLMRHALSVSESNYIARNMLATDLVFEGKPDEAIAEFERITKADPVYDKAQNALGMVYVQKGQLDEAISHFGSAIEFNPQYADPYNRLGAALMDEGRVDEAIPYFHKALEFSPNHPSAWANLGAAFEAKGDTGQAIGYYSRALQITIGHITSAGMPEAVQAAAKINFRMGDLLARSGKMAEAQDRYLEALKFSPGYQPAADRLRSLGSR